MSHFPARVTVSKEALENNFQKVQQIVGQTSTVMAIVKADAYGHGLIGATQCFIDAGATWFGVAKVSEALRLRSHFPNIRLLSWIYGVDAPFQKMVEAQLDLSVSTIWEIEKIAAACESLGLVGTDKIPRIHLKVDTGFGRNGFTLDNPAFRAAIKLLSSFEKRGVLKCEALWSHLGCSDSLTFASSSSSSVIPCPDTESTSVAPETQDHATLSDPSVIAGSDLQSHSDGRAVTFRQIEQFEKALQMVRKGGLDPKYRHIAASAAILQHQELPKLFDSDLCNMVRPGIILYGLSPNPQTLSTEQFGLRPAMRLEVQMNNVKSIKKGEGISYGHLYHTKADTKIGVVPLGYADGILRSCSGSDQKTGAPVVFQEENGTFTRAVVAGNICMDQLLIDLTDGTTAKAGDWVTLFGYDKGEPTVDDWAKVADTINYEIITKITSEAPRKLQ
jgi:alanine racemase